MRTDTEGAPTRPRAVESRSAVTTAAADEITERGIPAEQPAHMRDSLQRSLLVYGVLASLLYAAMLIFVPTRWASYISSDQTVSELSAIGSPTRPLWLSLASVYTVLSAAFGVGIWRSAAGNRRLRIVGALTIAQAVIGAFWPPMHLRGIPPTLTDALHVAFAVAWLVLMLLVMGFGAAALGRRFRLYSVITVVVFAVFGTLTGVQGPRLAENLPTPWIGVWERVNIGAALLWTAALAVALLRARGDLPGRAAMADRTRAESGVPERRS